ncbi:unnamed protein product [Parajaminaea phylloscopi]
MPARPRQRSALGASRPAPAPPQQAPPVTSTKGTNRQQQQQQRTSESSQHSDQNIKGGTSRSLWQSYQALSPRTRLQLGIGLAVFSGVGILISDQLETVLPAPPLSEANGGRKFGFTVVDRAPKPSS